MIRIRIWNPATHRARVWRACYLTGVETGTDGQAYLQTEVIGTGERVTIELGPEELGELSKRN